MSSHGKSQPEESVHTPSPSAAAEGEGETTAESSDTASSQEGELDDFATAFAAINKLFPGPAGQPQEDECEALRMKAKGLYDDGDAEGSVETYAQVFELRAVKRARSPSKKDTPMVRGLEALAPILGTDGLWKTSIDWFVIGRAFTTLCQFGFALSCFTKSIECLPGVPSMLGVLPLRALVHLELRHLQSAIKDASEAVLLLKGGPRARATDQPFRGPKKAFGCQAYSVWGQALVLLGRHELALNVLDEMLKLAKAADEDFSVGVSMGLRALAQCHLGHFGKAASDLLVSFTADPDFPVFFDFLRSWPESGKRARKNRKELSQFLPKIPQNKATRRLAKLLASYGPQAVPGEFCSKCRTFETFESDESGAPPVHLRRCSSCRAAWYCSKECQAGHWSEHKRACRLRLIVKKFLFSKP